MDLRHLKECQTLAEALRFVPHTCQAASASIDDIVAQTAHTAGAIAHQLRKIAESDVSVISEAHKLDYGNRQVRSECHQGTEILDASTTRLIWYLRQRAAQMVVLAEETGALLAHIRAAELLDLNVRKLAHTVITAGTRTGGDERGTTEILSQVGRLADRSASAVTGMRVDVLDIGARIQKVLTANNLFEQCEQENIEQPTFAALLQSFVAEQQRTYHVIGELLFQIVVTTGRVGEEMTSPDIRGLQLAWRNSMPQQRRPPGPAGLCALR